MSSYLFSCSPGPTCLGLALPTVGWAVLHQSAFKKMLRSRANLMEASPQLRVHLLGVSS